MHYRRFVCWTNKLCIHLCLLVWHHQEAAELWCHLALPVEDTSKIHSYCWRYQTQTHSCLFDCKSSVILSITLTEEQHCWSVPKSASPEIHIYNIFTSVKKSVPEIWLKVRCTRGPCTVQSTVTLPRPGAVLNTDNDSLSPVI